MSAHHRDVCITGYGLVSPLGETDDARWDALTTGSWREVRDDTTFAPFSVFPVGDLDLSTQIPRPGDQRAMGPMMQYGAYAAGLALDMAGIKGNEELLLKTHLVAAAGGGERDWELDEKILGDLPATNDREALLNRELADGLRPTLFLAQLPNLFAGNISLVHGVAGSSRTFMGEEPAGVDAVRIGFERVRSGQIDIALVGAAFNGARPDLHLMYHAGGILSTDPSRGLWEGGDAGINLGSAGGFVVLESRDSAEARGVATLARLKAVMNGRTTRSADKAGDVAAREWAAREWAAATGGDLPAALLSGASGYGPPTRDEHAWLMDLAAAGLAVRATATAVGHSMEASFLQNLILGIMSVRRGDLFGPLSDDPVEAGSPKGPVSSMAITAWGHLRGEGVAIVEADDGN